MKVLIAISISREWVESDFMRQYGSWIIPDGYQVKFGWFQQFSAPERHNVAMNEAMFNFDKILFMDTDQTYPPDYLVRMLAHKEPVVTALDVSRYHPYEFTIYDIDGEEQRYGETVPRFEPVTPPVDKRVFECDITGTAALMLDVEVLDSLRHPFFKDIYDNTGCVRVMPDDFYFFWQLNKAGIRVTVDQSIVVKHKAKVDVAPYNREDLKKAWDSVNSGFGYWKDGKL